MDKGRRLYSLVVDNAKIGKRFVIAIDEYDLESKQNVARKQTFLTNIDSYTTNFANEQELFKDLTEQRKIDFTNGRVKIVYNAVDGENSLGVIYKEQTLLKSFAQKYRTYIDEKDAEFQHQFNIFLREIKQGVFYRFMIGELPNHDKRHIKKRLRDLIYEYLYTGSNIESDKRLVKDKLIKEFCRYKAFRDYILGKQLYERKFGIQSKEPTYQDEVENELEEPFHQVELEFNPQEPINQNELVVDKEVKQNDIYEQMGIEFSAEDKEKLKTNNIKEKNKEDIDEKPLIIPNEEYLNSLTKDELLLYYGLDGLERMGIGLETNDKAPLFDGLGKVKKI